MWTLMPQPQHCGAQLHARKRARSRAPAEAVANRSAQDHEQAGFGAPGAPPARRVEDAGKDHLTFAPEPPPSWDAAAEPERAKKRARKDLAADDDDLPLPEGK